VANIADVKGVAEALPSDPMIQAMMAADGVSGTQLRAMLAQTGLRLSTPHPDTAAAFRVDRYGVAIVLFNAPGDVLIARRTGPTDGTRQMPPCASFGKRSARRGRGAGRKRRLVPL
jgi:hypothetical protein